MFLHAPGTINSAAPGRYTVPRCTGSEHAINDPVTKLGADGIGVALVLRRGKETLLMPGTQPIKLPRVADPTLRYDGIDTLRATPIIVSALIAARVS